MRALFIGGTGTISSAISRLAIDLGWDLTLLNRGSHKDRLPQGASQILADINDESQVAALLKDQFYDVIVDFVAFTPDQIERDIRLFTGRCRQFIFISSASAYQKPPLSFPITESTPLANPYWQYSRDKIACEDLLVKAYRATGFPATIVRPSHTYNDWSLPLAIRGKGPGQTILRLKQNKPVIVIGDGTSLWTVTHSHDFAKAFVGLMGNIHTIGEAFHITSDEYLSWNQIYECIASALGVKANLFHVTSDKLIAHDPELAGPLLGDKSNCAIFDNSKIKRFVPGFAAKIRFDQGVRRSLAYLTSQPDQQLADPAWDAFVEKIIRLEQPAAENI